MKKTISLHIEELPEGPYLATSPDIHGLVVQEDTIGEILETVCELTPRILELEAELEQGTQTPAQTVSVSIKMPLTIPLVISPA